MLSFEDCQLTFEDLRDNLDLRDDANSKLCDLCKTKWGINICIVCLVKIFYVPLILQVCTRNLILICLDLLLDPSHLIIRLHQVFNRTLYLTFRILLHHHAQLHLYFAFFADKGHHGGGTISDLDDEVGNTPKSEDPFKIGASSTPVLWKNTEVPQFPSFPVRDPCYPLDQAIVFIVLSTVVHLLLLRKFPVTLATAGLLLP